MSSGKKDSRSTENHSEESEAAIQEQNDVKIDELDSAASNALGVQEKEQESVSQPIDTEAPTQEVSSTADDGAEKVLSNDVDAPIVEEHFETLSCLINDFPIDRRFADFALRTDVVLGLQEKGYQTATRYQQAILHQLLQGKDCWVNARLSSNRGVSFGAYFTEVAACALNKMSVVICSAIPEVRRKFANDILDLAIFTDVQVALIQKPIEPEATVDISVQPNILITSPTNFWSLVSQKKVDVSQVDVLYLDEVERMLCEEDIAAISNCLSLINQQPQLVIQSVSLSKSLVQSVEVWSSGLQPLVFEKIDASDQGLHHISKSFSVPDLHSILLQHHLSRTIVACQTDEEVEDVGIQLAKIGWDVDILRMNSHPKQKERSERKLKLGQLQILVCTTDILLKINPSNVSHLMFKDACSKQQYQQIQKSFSRTEIFIFGSLGEIEGEWRSYKLPSEEESLSQQNQKVLEVLRKNSTRLGFTSYEGLVDNILALPDGKSLLALAVRQAMQLDRISTLDSMEETLRLENKDIFQRKRNHRRSKHPRRKFNKRR